jgi:rSAM/selenodomain-associated transferase 2
MSRTWQRGPGEPALSFVIPTRNEAATLPPLLSQLSALPFEHEVIVVDGDSTDGTRDVARSAGAVVLETRAGRGAQLSAGAAAASGNVFCFLHADVQLDARAVAALEQAVLDARERPSVFRLRIDARGLVYRLIEFMANGVRTRILRMPYGDQGLIVSRNAYEAAGGYPALPLMEDVEIIRALRRRVRIRVLDASLTVSPRRWERDGPWRRTFVNWGIMIAYSCGVSAERLATWYGREGGLR